MMDQTVATATNGHAGGPESAALKMAQRFEFDRGEIVEILWLDSASGHGWSKLEDELNNNDRWRAMHCRSVGYVIMENDDVIEMVCGMSGATYVSCTTMVPKFAVVERRVLAEAMKH